MLDLVQLPEYSRPGFVSCQWEMVVPGWISNASTTTTSPDPWLSCRPATVIVNVCWPALKSLTVMTGVWASSVGRAKRFTSRGGPPSTLTSAMPMPRPRLPIQRIELPVKVIEAVAPAVDDCIAEPPLHPKLASLRTHGPLNTTLPLDSSTRLSNEGSPAGGPAGPPKGWRVMFRVCTRPLTVVVKVAVSPTKRTVAEPTCVTR